MPIWLLLPRIISESYKMPSWYIFILKRPESIKLMFTMSTWKILSILSYRLTKWNGTLQCRILLQRKSNYWNPIKWNWCWCWEIWNLPRRSLLPSGYCWPYTLSSWKICSSWGIESGDRLYSLYIWKVLLNLRTDSSYRRLWSRILLSNRF